MFMIDQVKPEHKIFFSKKKVIDTFAFKLCLAIFLAAAVSVDFTPGWPPWI